MHYSSIFIAFVAALTVSSLPLNINLGAYSPALVVGDGEISFGAGEDASALLETLSGASEEPEAAAGEATGTAKQAEEVAKRYIDGENERDLTGFNAALDFATGALKTSPGVQLGTGAEGSGVGIIVEPGVDAAGAATERIILGKRDVELIEAEAEV